MRVFGKRRDAVGEANGGVVGAVGGGAGAAKQKSYRDRVPLPVRMEQVAIIKSKFPGKIPVVVERFKKEKDLPALDKTKFLVPQEVTASQLVTIIRNRMNIGPNQAMYLLINNRAITSMSVTIKEMYSEHRDEDGFLYITYASQEIFG